MTRGFNEVAAEYSLLGMGGRWCFGVITGGQGRWSSRIALLCCVYAGRMAGLGPAWDCAGISGH
jgi:hypothetical protein